MEIQEAIQELWRRSGKGKEQYASEVGYHETHIKNVLNGKQPGSFRILQACLEHAGIQESDAITLPATDEGRTENDDALALIRQALLTSGGNRERVLELADTLRRRMKKVAAAAVVNTRGRADPRKVKRPANTGHG